MLDEATRRRAPAAAPPVEAPPTAAGSASSPPARDTTPATPAWPASLRQRATTTWARAHLRLAPLVRRSGPVLGVVSPLGWSVLVAAVAAWVAADQLHWVELRLFATVAVCLVAVCLLTLVGRTVLGVEVRVRPVRVTVGEPSAGQVLVTNRAARRLLPVTLEVPVAEAGVRFLLPRLQPGVRHEEVFIVPTDVRGVFPVGPASTVRGDPLGLVRRKVAWTGVTELFVLPVTAPLEPFGTGLVRDLEGRTTPDVSMSDLAFHTLRDYAPGDDRRHIHWRSSAKLGSRKPDGGFLVRQFLDTRRTHAAVVVDGRPAAYRDDAEFELAVSVGASIARRAVGDEIDCTVAVADHLAGADAGMRVRGPCARAGAGTGDLSVLTVAASRLGRDLSAAFLVTGSATGFVDLRRAAAHLAPDVTIVALCIDTSAAASLRTTERFTVLTVPALTDLAGLLRVVGAA